MCRIGLIVNGSQEDAVHIGRAQVHGGNRAPCIHTFGNMRFIFNRFDVTTEAYAAESFPLAGKRFLLAYNGEVFGFRGTRYRDTDFSSDVHFGLNVLEQYGLEAFAGECDLQGSFFIHDQLENRTWILVDQLNSLGAFYACYAGRLVLASEHAVVHQILMAWEAPSTVPIHIVGNGNLCQIHADGSLVQNPCRSHAMATWMGSDRGMAQFQTCAQVLRSALEEAVIARIPRTGPVPVFCSGGIDSSLVLTLVHHFLKEQGQLERLQVVTLGHLMPSAPEVDDLAHVILLLEFLGTPRESLIVLTPSEANDDLEFLYRELVFCDQPYLIPVNPILNSQVRHTVLMSAVLAYYSRRYPEAKTILSGDAADEIFGGYPSMYAHIQDASALRQSVHDKLTDLPLNDAGRVALASCRGTATLQMKYYREQLHRTHPGLPPEWLAQIQAAGREEVIDFWRGQGRDDLAEEVPRWLQPLEVRLPYTSHLVLHALARAAPEFMLGHVGDRHLSKLLLRAVAAGLGLPDAITFRPKIPFHQGATGIANQEETELETKHAHQIAPNLPPMDLQTDLPHLIRLGLIHSRSQLAAEKPELILYRAAKNAGLDRLLAGNAFREHMPDAVYGELPPKEHPTTFMQCSPKAQPWRNHAS